MATTLAERLVSEGICPSKGDARRLALQGALRLGGRRVSDADEPLAIPSGSVVLVHVGGRLVGFWGHGPESWIDAIPPEAIP